MCEFCGTRPLVVRRDARTCGHPDCLRAHNRARRLDYYRRLERIDRAYSCQACAAAIILPPGTMGGPRALCAECRALGQSVADVLLRRSVEEYACDGCGNAFTRKPTKGQRPRWCSPACMRQSKVGSRRAADFRRRSRLASADTEQFEPLEIYERDGWRCRVPGCGRVVRRDKSWPHPLSPTLDHIIPVSEGGHHVRANVRCAHARCNTSRGNRGGNDQLLLIG